jgi:hypothetical protein
MIFGAARVAAAAMAPVALARPLPRPMRRNAALSYMIPADASPGFDGHRESTFAAVRGFAPFYSLLIKVHPDDPGSPKHPHPRAATHPTRHAVANARQQDPEPTLTSTARTPFHS